MEEIQKTENDIDTMVNEVSVVLKTHLTNIIKNIEDDSETLQILNNLPIVKNLKSENFNLKKEIIELKSEIAFLRNDIGEKCNQKPHLQLDITELNNEDIKQIKIEKNPFIIGSTITDSKQMSIYESDDELDDDGVKNTSYMKCILNAQKNADQYATIDSESDDDREDDENTAEEERIAMGFKDEVNSENQDNVEKDDKEEEEKKDEGR